MKTRSPISASAAAYSADDIDRVIARAFSGWHEPRSKAYQQGVRSTVTLWLTGTRLPPPPYPMGTASADAYLAGQDEGRRIGGIETGGAA